MLVGFVMNAETIRSRSGSEIRWAPCVRECFPITIGDARDTCGGKWVCHESGETMLDSGDIRAEPLSAHSRVLHGNSAGRNNRSAYPYFARMTWKRWKWWSFWRVSVTNGASNIQRQWLPSGDCNGNHKKVSLIVSMICTDAICYVQKRNFSFTTNRWNGRCVQQLCTIQPRACG